MKYHLVNGDLKKCTAQTSETCKAISTNNEPIEHYDLTGKSPKDIQKIKNAIVQYYYYKKEIETIEKRLKNAKTSHRYLAKTSLLNNNFTTIAYKKLTEEEIFTRSAYLIASKFNIPDVKEHFHYRYAQTFNGKEYLKKNENNKIFNETITNNSKNIELENVKDIPTLIQYIQDNHVHNIKDNINDYSDYLEHGNKWLKTLQKHEINAIASWTKDASVTNLIKNPETNNAYIEDSFYETYLDIEEENIEDYLNLVNTSLKKYQRNKPRNIYRGIRLPDTMDSLLSKEISENEVYDNFSVGKTVIIPDITSTTLNISESTQFSDGVIFKMNTVHGAEIGTVSYYGLAESEVLLPQNTKFMTRKITKEKIGSKTYFIIELDDINEETI